MPSASSKQHRFMSAVAHNPTFAKKAGVPQSVGKDFAAADKGRKFGRGGSTNINSKETDMKNMRPSNLGMARRMPMRPTGTRAPAMPPKMAGGMMAGGKVKTFKRGGNAGKVAALAGILGLGALALRDKKPAPVEDRRVSASVPTKVKAPEIMPSTRDNDEFYGYDNAVRNAKLTSEDYYGYDDAVRNAKLMNEDYYGYDAAVKKAAKMKPVAQRIPSSVKQTRMREIMPSMRDNYKLYEYDDAVRNAKLMSEDYSGYDDAVRNAKLTSEDYYGYDDAVKKAAEMKPAVQRIPSSVKQTRITNPNFAKGGMPMKDGKPAFMQKKMMGGGMAKYAKGGGIESHGKTRGTVVRMASGGSVSSRADGIAQRGKTRGKMC